MADKKNKYSENKSGPFYVDHECIACDACAMAAPNNFQIDEEDGHAYVKKQPQNETEKDQVLEAMECCPVEAIGNDGEDSPSIN